MADPKKTASTEPKPDAKSNAPAGQKTDAPQGSGPDEEVREFILASNVLASGERRAAGEKVSLPREGHAELFALGAVTEPWPNPEDTKTTD